MRGDISQYVAQTFRSANIGRSKDLRYRLEGKCPIAHSERKEKEKTCK